MIADARFAVATFGDGTDERYQPPRVPVRKPPARKPLPPPRTQHDAHVIAATLRVLASACRAHGHARVAKHLRMTLGELKTAMRTRAPRLRARVRACGLPLPRTQK